MLARLCERRDSRAQQYACRAGIRGVGRCLENLPLYENLPLCERRWCATATEAAARPFGVLAICFRARVFRVIRSLRFVPMQLSPVRARCCVTRGNRPAACRCDRRAATSLQSLETRRIVVEPVKSPRLHHVHRRRRCAGRFRRISPVADNVLEETDREVGHGYLVRYGACRMRVNRRRLEFPAGDHSRLRRRESPLQQHEWPYAQRAMARSPRDRSHRSARLHSD